MSSAAQATRYRGTFPGRPEQIARVRQEIRRYLSGAGRPADDAVLVISELSANAALHSRSRNDFFTVSVVVHPTYLFIEVEDAGGYWEMKLPGTGHPHHGLDIVEALTGADGWGIDGDGDGPGRVVWARLESGQ